MMFKEQSGENMAGGRKIYEVNIHTHEFFFGFFLFMHVCTLCVPDIKVEEQSDENMARVRKICKVYL